MEIINNPHLEEHIDIVADWIINDCDNTKSEIAWLLKKLFVEQVEWVVEDDHIRTLNEDITNIYSEVIERKKEVNLTKHEEKALDKLTKQEEEELKKRLDEIELEQRNAWGLHRISGGFVKAEYDYVEDDKIYITITDGIQSDCQDTTNVTHCSLWRNNLEWTD